MKRRHHIILCFFILISFSGILPACAQQTDSTEAVMSNTDSASVEDDDIFEEDTEEEEMPALSPQQPYTPPLRNVPDSLVEKIKKDKDFRYANDPSYWKKDPENNYAFLNWLAKLFNTGIFQWILYIILGLIILFVLYQVIVVNNFFVFSRSRKKKRQQQQEENDEDLTAENLDKKIQHAVAANEFRAAIRYLYLKTLKVLEEKSRIKLHAKSTNQDYIRQMQTAPDAEQFRQLTFIYEYVWYGEFQPGDQQFSLIHNNFNQFISRA